VVDDNVGGERKRRESVVEGLIYNAWFRQGV